jgi:hypothetical protein
MDWVLQDAGPQMFRLDFWADVCRGLMQIHTGRMQSNSFMARDVDLLLLAGKQSFLCASWVFSNKSQAAIVDCPRLLI